MEMRPPEQNAKDILKSTVQDLLRDKRLNMHYIEGEDSSTHRSFFELLTVAKNWDLTWLEGDNLLLAHMGEYNQKPEDDFWIQWYQNYVTFRADVGHPEDGVAYFQERFNEYAGRREEQPVTLTYNAFSFIEHLYAHEYREEAFSLLTMPEQPTSSASVFAIHVFDEIGKQGSIADIQQLRAYKQYVLTPEFLTEHDWTRKEAETEMLIRMREGNTETDTIMSLLATVKELSNEDVDYLLFLTNNVLPVVADKPQQPVVPFIHQRIMDEIAYFVERYPRMYPDKLQDEKDTTLMTAAEGVIDAVQTLSRHYAPLTQDLLEGDRIQNKPGFYDLLDSLPPDSSEYKIIPLMRVFLRDEDLSQEFLRSMYATAMAHFSEDFGDSLRAGYAESLSVRDPKEAVRIRNEIADPDEREVVKKRMFTKQTREYERNLADWRKTIDKLEDPTQKESLLYDLGEIAVQRKEWGVVRDIIATKQLRFSDLSTLLYSAL